MTISEIKILVNKTNQLLSKEQSRIAYSLSIFDCCNYVLWMEKLYNIKIII